MQRPEGLASSILLARPSMRFYLDEIGCRTKPG